MKLLSSNFDGKAWRIVVASFACLVLGSMFLSLHLDLKFLPASMALILVGLFGLAGWAFAVRFLLLETWGSRFWLGVAIAAGCLNFFGNVGLGFAIAMSFIMLTFRMYRPWRQISDRRRAVGFGLGIIALVLAFLATRLADVPVQNGINRLARNLGIWSTWSLIIFWVCSLFHLATKMRLHFLRLRPKLAISAVMIGLVPLLVLFVLGLMVGYTTLGGARAARLNNSLDSWQDLVSQGVDFNGAVFDTTFSWPEAAEITNPEVSVLSAPEWVPVLSSVLKSKMEKRSPAVSDTTEYFLIKGDIWLMRWQDLLTESPKVTAWQIGPKPLRRLSRILKAGIDINDPGLSGDGQSISFSTGEHSTTGNGVSVNNQDHIYSESYVNELSVSYRDSSGVETEFWSKNLFFGGTFREMIFIQEDKLGTTTPFIQLRVGWPDFKSEFLDSGANINVLVVIGLGLSIFVFLVIEFFAVFFGARISEGIVTGVHALHRGTKAVTEGNLETVITIPNEDEFGDLASSFNEMTLAVQHGREIALANDRLKQELQTARAIQVRLLPSNEPVLLDFEVTGASIPSREIGGDYYDFLAQGDDKIGIAIGDVSGKGMPAALLMSNLQASLHGQVLHPGSVSGVVERVNNLLVNSTDPHMFATFFYGLLDARSGSFTCTNAGHNPPLFLRTDGTLDELTQGGLLLGMMGEMPYKQDTVQMAPGEVIVLYTDGITEAVGPSAEEDDPEAMFGEEALHDVIRLNRHLPASEIKDAILKAVEIHTSGVRQSDDITLVVIRRQN